MTSVKCAFGEKAETSSDGYFDYYRHQFKVDGKTWYLVLSTHDNMVSSIGGNDENSFQIYKPNLEKLDRKERAIVAPYLEGTNYAVPNCTPLTEADGKAVIEKELSQRLKSVLEIKDRNFDDETMKRELKGYLKSALVSCSKTNSKKISEEVARIEADNGIVTFLGGIPNVEKKADGKSTGKNKMH